MSPARDYDRMVAALKLARAIVTGRSPQQVDEDIHRERLAILEAPDAGETFQAYSARMLDRHGLTFAAAVVDRHPDAQEGDDLAVTDAARELRRFMLPPQPKRRRSS